jgi:hypothetical protein
MEKSKSDGGSELPSGMTLRDYFAGQIIGVIYVNNQRNNHYLTMDDSEMLELAARACGYQVAASYDHYVIIRSRDGYRFTLNWQPHIDLYECLQMEITLRLTIAWEPMKNSWRVGAIVGDTFAWLAEHQDRQRASVMAAAELGKWKLNNNQPL